MRQGEIAHKTAWEGNPLGGVSAPKPIVLPDPADRFARTAARLRFLATGHPMGEWLSFMASLSEAQERAATAIRVTAAAFDPAGLAKAGAAGMPPLAADGHRRDQAWRKGLAIILDDLGARSDLPAATGTAARDLHKAGEATWEQLADGYLAGGIDAGQAGQAIFVTAALQAYFTAQAARLAVDSLALLPERGLCPVCGSAPSAGVITASGNSPGVRYLHCSLCSTAWNHTRAICITCGKSEHLSLRTIDGGNKAVRAETCDDCQSYAKMLYQIDDPALDPFADDLASLGLDLLVAEAGWARHAPNPFLLAG